MQEHWLAFVPLRQTVCETLYLCTLENTLLLLSSVKASGNYQAMLTIALLEL